MWKTASASPGRTTPASRRRPRHPQRTLHACTQRSQGRGDLLHFTHLPIEVSALFMYFEHRQGPRTHVHAHVRQRAGAQSSCALWAGIGCGPDIDLYRPAPWSEGFVALRSTKADCMLKATRSHTTCRVALPGAHPATRRHARPRAAGRHSPKVAPKRPKRGVLEGA